MELLTFEPVPGSGASVQAYLHTPVWEMSVRRERYPAVVVCPGGAYAFVSQREAEPVALPFFARGYNVFVLTYTCGEQARDFAPLIQLSETVRRIRETPQWRVDPEHIAVCGFSAGGHLAGSLGVLWDDPEFLRHYGDRSGKNRPDAMLLCYPVLLANAYTHEESIRNVSGDVPGGERYRYFALDEHVSASTCPTFLWHTAEDGGVPVENTLLFALALQKARVPFEAHVFPTGGHGLSTCTAETCGTADPYNGRWLGLAMDWLDRQFGFTL